MAFVLSTWLGQRVVLQDKLYLQIYAKLGGKNLGQVELRNANKTLVEQVKDLQEQVAKLLVHPVRTSDYLSLELEGYKLPSFTYCDQVDKALGLEALKRLEECKSNSQVECMYDEDDSQALSKVQIIHELGTHDLNMRLHIKVRDVLVPEIRVLKYTHNPKHLLVWTESHGVQLDCSPLSCLTSLERLDFGNVNVKDWQFAQHLPLKGVDLWIEAFNNINFECLPLLEELSVKMPFNIRIDLQMPARLPTTLKAVYFPWAKPPNLPTWRDLEAAFQGDGRTLVVQTS